MHNTTITGADATAPIPAQLRALAAAMRIGIAQTQPLRGRYITVDGLSACALGAMVVGLVGRETARCYTANEIAQIICSYGAMETVGNVGPRNDRPERYGLPVGDPRPAIADWLDSEAARLDGGAS